MYSILFKGKDPTFPVVELHEISVGPFLQSVQVHLKGNTLTWCIHTEFCSSCKLAEGVLCPVTQVINEDVKQCWT